jgi:formylglycine-generating enzyme required for sulfatase activity
MPPDYLLSNHPRVNVTWYEASAFCRWLSLKLRKEVRLPSEAEWEKAARGEDGRTYPWGEDFDAAKCNTRETGLGQPTAVGMYPAGASPCGALDMSGNVWEWTSSPWTDNYALGEKDIGAPDAAPGFRVYRGGSAWRRDQDARSAFRFKSRPQFTEAGLGFRVLLSASRRSRA